MKRYDLAKVARREASKSFHGDVMGLKSNIHPIVELFPKWPMEKWQNRWCSAFVYYCVVKTGYKLPVRYDDESVSCNFAGCKAWEDWARLPQNDFYYSKEVKNFEPDRGDIVLYDEVFCGEPHDHIGIVVETSKNHIITAEGNLNNVSGIVRRRKDKHVRGYIRIPENYI